MEKKQSHIGSKYGWVIKILHQHPRMTVNKYSACFFTIHSYYYIRGGDNV